MPAENRHAGSEPGAPKPNLFVRLMLTRSGGSLIVAFVVLFLGWYLWVRVPFSQGIIVGFTQGIDGREQAYLSYQADTSNIGIANHDYPRVIIRQEGNRSGLGLRGRSSQRHATLLVEVLGNSTLEIRVEDGQGSVRGAAWQRDVRPDSQPPEFLRETMSPEEWRPIQDAFHSINEPIDGIGEPRISELLAGAEQVLRREGFHEIAGAVASRSVQTRSFRWTGFVILAGAALLLLGWILRDSIPLRLSRNR